METGNKALPGVLWLLVISVRDEWVVLASEGRTRRQKHPDSHSHCSSAHQEILQHSWVKRVWMAQSGPVRAELYEATPHTNSCFKHLPLEAFPPHSEVFGAFPELNLDLFQYFMILQERTEANAQPGGVGYEWCNIFLDVQAASADSNNQRHRVRGHSPAGLLYLHRLSPCTSPPASSLSSANRKRFLRCHLPPPERLSHVAVLHHNWSKSILKPPYVETRFIWKDTDQRVEVKVEL